MRIRVSAGANGPYNPGKEYSAATQPQHGLALEKVFVAIIVETREPLRVGLNPSRRRQRVPYELNVPPVGHVGPRHEAILDPGKRDSEGRWRYQWDFDDDGKYESLPRSDKQV